MLDVVVSKEHEGGSAPVVFIVRNVCKKPGTTQVNITLPRASSTALIELGDDLPPDAVDQDPSDQVSFGYHKICSSADDSKVLSFLGYSSSTQWDVPTGGWRFLLAGGC